ncbi:MAG: TonB-dependent receptor [Saprospiraceae bacterium]
MSHFSLLLRFCVLFIGCSFCLFAVGNAQSITFTGLVVEAGSQQPVEFATVKALDKESRALVAGTTTDFDGRFELIVPSLNVELEFTFIGFSPSLVSSFSESGTAQDLGTISLKLQGELLDDVIVTGKRSTTEFKLDRRVFNVGEDLSSSGASALELLNNVPSVTVDIEGGINLRGSSGVQVLIDGKPSVLASEGGALATITADMIEKVEVITNPSAKYEAEGSAGIINIVLKKEEKNGLSGSVTLNTGIPDNHSFGASLSRRSNKFNLFGQLGAGIRSLPRTNTNINQNFVDGTTVFSDGDGARNEKFVNLILGTDYRINDLNTLSLSGFFAYEWEENPSVNNFSVFADSVGGIIDAWQRTEDTEAGNPKWQYELNYTKQFDADDKDHLLVLSALGNAFKKDQSSDFTTTTSEGVARFGDQKTATNFGEVVYTLKADYTRPINEKVTIETGAQYVRNDVGNEFETQDRVGNNFVIDPAFSNEFEFDQGVLGVYATGSYEGDKWGVKGGLRAEQTDVETFLLNTNERNPQKYTNLFPSLATSYKLNEITSFQASYSKRIFRPRLWNLNPFFNVSNNFNVRAGNPNLGPEFTDSYEFTGIVIFDKVSLNTGIYYRFTTDVVERITTQEGDVNISRPENIGTTGATGLELNAKYTPSKWLQLSTDLNYNTFNRKGEFEGQSFDFNADQLTGRLVTKIDLPADIALEVSGNGESSIQTLQGREQSFMWMDVGVRKKVLKGRIVVSAGVRDVFASRIFIREVNQPGFSTYRESFRGRFFTLGVSYGFGKGEAMEFVGRRRM